jgi:hypothetical protein
MIPARTLGFGLALVGLSALGCRPGYMKAEDLHRKEQGPSHCASRCHELGMEMGALVLVGDQLPGCVCVPRGARAQAAQTGASAATTGYGVVLAAAAAARQQQQHQHQQQQQQRR